MDRRHVLIIIGGALLIVGIGSLLDPQNKPLSLVVLITGAACTAYGAWFSTK